MSQSKLFDIEPDPKSQKSEPKTAEPQKDAATDANVIAAVYAIARAIPPGRVMSYGAVGARCEPPISGYICGRIMIHAHKDVPWWRVVGKDGTLRVSKRNPLFARDQRDRLEGEGVVFDENGRVKMAEFADD
jgi:methylated-DNA-protein-cysteine methyltransferase-like protein